MNVFGRAVAVEALLPALLTAQSLATNSWFVLVLPPLTRPRMLAYSALDSLVGCVRLPRELGHYGGPVWTNLLLLTPLWRFLPRRSYRVSAPSRRRHQGRACMPVGASTPCAGVLPRFIGRTDLRGQPFFQKLTPTPTTNLVSVCSWPSAGVAS